MECGSSSFSYTKPMFNLKLFINLHCRTHCVLWKSESKTCFVLLATCIRLPTWVMTTTNLSFLLPCLWRRETHSFSNLVPLRTLCWWTSKKIFPPSCPARCVSVYFAMMCNKCEIWCSYSSWELLMGSGITSWHENRCLGMNECLDDCADLNCFFFFLPT